MPKKDHRKTCDIGNHGSSDCAGQKLDIYYDSRIGTSSRWANMCESCFKLHGAARLGLGIAQKFQWDADANAYRKVSG